MRLFTLAVQHNFVQGRKTENVCSACLYIVCRREKTPHLLIDFSDLLRTNVFPLGQTFLKLVRQPPLARSSRGRQAVSPASTVTNVYLIAT